MSIHSSIVENQDTLISKWGIGLLTKHHKNDLVDIGDVGTINIYTYYRRIINTPNQISGPYTFNGTGVYEFYPTISPTTCTWSVEPAAIFQVSSGTGERAVLNYATPFVHLAPKATITFTFSYGCDNHYTVSKEFDLRIPTTTISGVAESDGFVIDNHSIVTVTGKIKSNKNAKAIVPVGTKLVLNGGTMTGNGNSMWTGIEVWGNSTAHQFPDGNGRYAQGYVEMKNGATIENAECALALWRPNHWSTTGGIVHAENATFRNCAKAVHALHYANHHPATGKETAYNSRFRNCTFAIDNGYLGTTAFHKHADLNHVDGIGFIGCDFSADRTAANVSPWCIGIGAYTSGFAATAFCDHGGGDVVIEPCPDDMVKGCSFTGFHMGIHADNDGSAARSFNVRKATFSNNTCGIHALNTGFATILESDFTVGVGSHCDYGIYADGVTGFCIEENAFRPRLPGTGTTYGIVVRNAQGANDIYSNTFDGLACGNAAVGCNMAATGLAGARPRQAGLTYTCNENTGNAVDFCVIGGDGTTSGIQPLQGSPAMPAGNTFGGSQWHFHNGGDFQLTYYHNAAANGQAPDPARLHRVTPVATTTANACLPHYGGNGPLRSDEEKDGIEEAYLAARNAYASLERLYDSRIDGGSTPAETADIATAAPSDLWRLRAKLLGHSPYLSHEALTAAADRDDLFPEATLFEILAANPDELKKDTLVRYMESKANPLPQYMTDLLRQMAAGTTARTAIEAQMGKAARDFGLAAGDIVRSNLADTVADPEGLRAWLGSMEGLAADRMAVASLVQQGDFAEALALANSLPGLYGLQDGELAEYADYMALLELHHTLAATGRNTAQMDAGEAAMVEAVADNGTGVAQAMAEAMLSSLHDDRAAAFDCPSLPTDASGRGGQNTIDEAAMNRALGFHVSLSPNPASTWVAVDYTLPADAATATLVVTNTLGVAVVTEELNGSQGQKVLDLRPLAAGIYGYDVRCGEYVLNGKMVVTK